MFHDLAALMGAATPIEDASALSEILIGAAGGAVFAVVSIVRSDEDATARAKLSDPVFWLANALRIGTGAFLVWLIRDTRVDPFVTGAGAVGLIALLIGQRNND